MRIIVREAQELLNGKFGQIFKIVIKLPRNSVNLLFILQFRLLKSFLTLHWTLILFMYYFYIFLILLLSKVHNQLIKFNKAKSPDNRQLNFTKNSNNDLLSRDRLIFEEFKVKNSKKYRNQEQQNVRFKYFRESLRQVENHNPASSFKKKINKFADFEKNQWKKIFLTSPERLIDPSEKPTTELINIYKHKSIKRRVLQQPIANQLDWRLKISFTPVKYQGMCSSCYVYASIGAIQAGTAIFYSKYNQGFTFSEQQAIDCCNETDARCGGCNNGYISLAYKYYAQKGISLQEDYPFIYANQAQPCNQNAIKRNYLNKTKPYLFLKSLSSAKYYLNQRPISSMVDASQWRLYSEGIYDLCSVNFTLNHGVVLIGYEDTGNWIVRNSWGEWWGQSGYIRIMPLNSCGITQYMYIPIFLNQ